MMKYRWGQMGRRESAPSAADYRLLSNQGPEKVEGFECPCCGRYRDGETGEEFEGEKICVSCLEGIIED